MNAPELDAALLELARLIGREIRAGKLVAPTAAGACIEVNLRLRDARFPLLMAPIPDKENT
jgi:hypothetical protein